MNLLDYMTNGKKYVKSTDELGYEHEKAVARLKEIGERLELLNVELIKEVDKRNFKLGDSDPIIAILNDTQIISDMVSGISYNDIENVDNDHWREMWGRLIHG